ncbi:MerR family transcriptional regulator [Deinococcus misasensis]|uniref:MerR family transcriptional regulator n=1 Tax=Deinococcus misasensis TaxID=392413 RepID=UPI000ABDA53F|nr:MerR family transcriptional regulator [Deinococcus misasensis]
MSASHRLPIGKFSQLTRISVRSLRFYDQVGLFRPLYTDPDTGYRYYQPEQFEVAERIRMFRSMDVSLEDIRTILDSNHPDTTREVLERHRQQVLQQIQTCQRILEQLDRISEEKQSYRVEEVWLSDVPLIGYSTISGLKDIERYRLEAVRKLTPLASGGVLYAIQKNLLDPERLQGLMEHQRVLNPRAFEVTFGMQVPDTQSPVKLPLQYAIVPEGKYLKATHYGPYEPLHLAHQAVVRHAQEHKLALGDLTFEQFVVGPWQQEDSAMWVTHIFCQVAEI